MNALVDQLSFNPWYTTDAFRPLGNMNRARKEAYRASAAQRLGNRFCEEPTRRNLIAGRIARVGFALLNRFVPWHRLPRSLGLLNLAILRSELREKNLIDTQPHANAPTTYPAPSPIPEAVRTARTHDGTFNDLSNPAMGSIGSAFGRNMRPVYQPDKFDRPDPILVSRELLTRDTFIPAKSLNVLAAAWIQFQVHDWVNHARFDLGEEGKDIVLPRPRAESWRNHKTFQPEPDMRIAGNKSSVIRPPAIRSFPISPPPGGMARKSTATSPEGGRTARGCLASSRGRLSADRSERHQRHWVQRSLVAGAQRSCIRCSRANTTSSAGRCRSAYPAWPDERVYQTATADHCGTDCQDPHGGMDPCDPGDQTVETALRANWYGAPKDWLTQLGIWLFEAHALKAFPRPGPIITLRPTR